MENEKEKIRFLYTELQGCLTQAPDKSDCVSDKSIWEHYNDIVKQLNKITMEDYNRFCISPEPDETSISASAYRQKLGSLIAHLYGKYFSDEQTPFREMPHTIISQTQQQNLAVFFQMVFEFQDKIEQSMEKFSDGSKEKTFLQKLKGSLRNITDITDIVFKIVKIAKESGLSVEDLGKIFS